MSPKSPVVDEHSDRRYVRYRRFYFLSEHPMLNPAFLGEAIQWPNSPWYPVLYFLTNLLPRPTCVILHATMLTALLPHP